jgi:hypothetical protein
MTTYKLVLLRHGERYTRETDSFIFKSQFNFVSVNGIKKIYFVDGMMRIYQKKELKKPNKLAKYN